MAADDTFDEKFRDWNHTVKGPKGKLRPRELTDLLGVRPGEFVKLPHDEEVVRARRLLFRIPERPALTGDPAKLAEFQAAYELLAGCVKLRESAEKEEKKAAKALAKATRAFDNAWGIVVRTVKQSKGNEAALEEIPLFRRSRTPQEEALPEEPEEEPVEEAEAEPAEEEEPAEEPEAGSISEPKAPELPVTEPAAPRS